MDKKDNGKDYRGDLRIISCVGSSIVSNSCIGLVWLMVAINLFVASSPISIAGCTTVDSAGFKDAAICVFEKPITATSAGT